MKSYLTKGGESLAARESQACGNEPLRESQACA